MDIANSPESMPKKKKELLRCDHLHRTACKNAASLSDKYERRTQLPEHGLKKQRHTAHPS
jgi:hypothetical protein